MKRAEFLGSTTVVSTLLLGRFDETGQCFAYDSLGATIFSWFFYVLGLLTIWFAILSSLIAGVLSLCNDTQPRIFAPVCATFLSVFFYFIAWYGDTIIDFVLRVECLPLVDGRTNLSNDEVHKIYIAQAIPQWLFVIIFPLWCVHEFDSTKKCRQLAFVNTRSVDDSKRTSNVRRVVRRTKT